MERATVAWLSTFDDPSDSAWIPGFVHKLNRSYVVYGSMLLLPSTAYDELDRHKTTTGAIDVDLLRLYKLIAHHLKITHIAVTRPIPPQDDDHGTENSLRAPKNFTPLHGDFGPSTCHSPPTREDFSTAFWTTAKQNGIYQVWAPRWTMFSRGNISEKARLLGLPSVALAVEEGEADGRGCAAVDLYAGVGYFTFSYLKAGVSKVVCWDLNPWSIEGLMRGAVANKWRARRVTDDDALDAGAVEGPRLLVFNEDNEMASARIQQARKFLPPVRHVNCGLLPTSMGSWKTAVEVLDTSVGGWLHLHENLAVNEIGPKVESIRQEIQRLAEERRQSTSDKNDVEAGPVTVENIDRLKSYAPGVMHCVIDIYIPPDLPS